MTESKERRAQKRVPAEVPVSLRPAGGGPPTAGRTRDLSSNGIFLYADSHLEPGSELEMVLILPAELTQGERRWVCCQAVVVRVENGGQTDGVGVAATIRTMELLPEITG
jgi:PilZ domain